MGRKTNDTQIINKNVLRLPPTPSPLAPSLPPNNKKGMLSATASLGMIKLWDLETGFSEIDKFSFSNQEYVKSGVLFATGMISCGVTSDMDAAYALLCDHMESNTNKQMKLCATIG